MRSFMGNGSGRTKKNRQKFLSNRLELIHKDFNLFQGQLTFRHTIAVLTYNLSL